MLIVNYSKARLQILAKSDVENPPLYPTHHFAQGSIVAADFVFQLMKYLLRVWSLMCIYVGLFTHIKGILSLESRPNHADPDTDLWAHSF